RSRKDKDKDEDLSTGSDKVLKKINTSKNAEPSKEEREFKVAGSDMPQDQEENPNNDDEEPKGKVASKRLAFKLLKGISSNYVEFEYDFKECYKALSEKLYWDNPEGGDYPFDLTKPLRLVMNGNRQMVPVDYFFNNDLKYLQGEILTMAYTTSLTKTKDAQYDLPNIKDMVPNIWSPVKVVYDKYALWGISHWRDQLTRVEVMRKHGYEYLKEIVVQRTDNDLYKCKKRDFLRLCMNDIEDMLLPVVQNRLTNLLGDDVFDFSIALRMFSEA
nr:hypothetical protein [Tanacetum cinerariifolium]